MFFLGLDPFADLDCLCDPRPSLLLQQAAAACQLVRVRRLTRLSAGLQAGGGRCLYARAPPLDRSGRAATTAAWPAPAPTARDEGPAAGAGTTGAAACRRARGQATDPLARLQHMELLRGTNQREMRSVADAMVSNGLVAAGYTVSHLPSQWLPDVAINSLLPLNLCPPRQYLNIDDLWAADQRNAQGEITEDLIKFPSGMPALAKYLKSRGMHLGL